MPRFVVLEHDHPELHWDLLLETGDVLRAWRLLTLPRADVWIPAAASFDHRKVYLDYEGPVSGNRGSVTRWDAGEYHLDREEPGRLLLNLEGRRLQGSAALEKDAEGDSWSFRFSPRPSERENSSD